MRSPLRGGAASVQKCEKHFGKITTTVATFANRWQEIIFWLARRENRTRYRGERRARQSRAPAAAEPAVVGGTDSAGYAGTALKGNKEHSGRKNGEQ